MDKRCGNCAKYLEGKCYDPTTVPVEYLCESWKPAMETTQGTTTAVESVNISVIPNSSPKDLSGKIQLSIVDPVFIEQVALCRMKGQDRYGVDSWKQVPAEQWLDAMYRHVLELVKGNQIKTKDWGIHHAAHIGANAMLYMMAKRETK